MVLSTATTTVLAILSETTLPVITRLGMGLLSLRLLRHGGLRLTKNGLQHRDAVADFADLAGVVELADRELEAQLEQLFLRGLQAGVQVVLGQTAERLQVLLAGLSFHWKGPPPGQQRPAAASS